MFDFLKKGGGDAPPDVGQEDEFDAEQEKKKPALKKVLKKKVVKKVVAESVGGVSDAEAEVVSKVSKVPVGGVEISKLEVDRLNARVEALQSLLKSFNERFSVVGQQIGEVRAMNLATEKAMSRSKIESAKASDIVKEVKPDKLRIDYQKIDMKVATLAEKIEANNQYAKTVMNEVKDLRHKAGVFLGTDALLQLNDDVKKDLIQLQKLSSRVRVNADKSEQLFIELRKGFADSQKLSAMVTNLDSFASDLKEEIDKLKLDHSQIVNQKDFGTFQKNVNNKFLGVDSTIEDVEKVKGENERLGRVIENIFSVVKRNKEDIGALGLSVGKNGIKKVDDYDNKILEILRVMEKMAGEVKEMKGKKSIGVKKRVKKIGVDVKKVIKPNVVEKEIVKPMVLEKTKGVRDLEEIEESAEESQKEVEPLKPVVPVKKVVRPVKEVKEKEVKIDIIENELKNIQETLGDSEVKSKVGDKIKEISSEVNKVEKEKIVESEKNFFLNKRKNVKGKEKVVAIKEKKIVKKGKSSKKKPEKKKLSKKVKLKELRLRNLKKARNAKKKLREVRLKNLKKARAVRKRNLKKK